MVAVGVESDAGTSFMAWSSASWPLAVLLLVESFEAGGGAG